jgi:spermidine/putrescine transport system substrate-binding protein
LRGLINVVPSMTDVIDLAIHYVGGEACTTDRDILRAARDVLVEAKTHWASIDYASFDKFINEDLQASVFWSGAAMRIRAENPGFTYGYPAEGFIQWQDNVAILADAQNVENARLFMNFLMDPESAGMISEYTGYPNGIMGSEAFMSAELQASPEMTIPAEFASAAHFQQTCPAEVQELYARIWTDLTN